MEWHIDTKCIQEGYKPGNGQPRVLPITQSTTFKYDDAATLGDLFDLKISGDFYTRLSNPTCNAVEAKIAALEGGVGAMLTSAGQAASMISILNIAQCGDHVVSCAAIYGGTYNLFNKTLRGMGIDVTFVSPDAGEAELCAAFRPNTKALFGETLTNPGLVVLDIEMYASVAHTHGVPLIVDNTFPTPVLCRPFEFGADIVVHSTSKYLDGHATALGGVIVDSGKFDWAASLTDSGEPRFPGLVRPDDTYHGLVYTEAFGAAAYIVKCRTHLLRDIGATASPTNAFILNSGIDTLHLRMERHCSNALRAAEYLEAHDMVTWVNYPGLSSNKYHKLAKKYLPGGCSGVIAFGVKGGRDAACRFMDNLRLAAPAIHVADLRTCVLHPASTTHRQLSDAQLVEAGVSPDLIRFSVGVEHPDDIIGDICQALAAL